MNPQDDNEMVSILPTDRVEIQPHPVRQVTTLSKYLALALFVMLPFIGAYVGYKFAPVQTVSITTPIPIVNNTISATTTSSEKTLPQILMYPFVETPQIKFFERSETEGSIKITFIPNSEYEKDNAEIIFDGTLEFYPSAFSGTWVGMFTPGNGTLGMLPTGEPDSLPEYFYIVDSDTVSVLCDSFDCVNFDEDTKYQAKISFKPDELTYEVFNSGFDSYSKTVTFDEVDIISQTN